ncbi:MAG TPA: GDSL-type esterase/lipase family protein [Vicinamibacteria bacterium]
MAERRRGRRPLAALAAVLAAAAALGALHRSAHALVLGRYSAKYTALLAAVTLGALALAALAWAWPRLPPRRPAELALALVSATLAFAGFDLLLGRWRLGPSTRLVVLDPVTHHRLRPGRHFVGRPGDYATWVTVNADGYRGPQRSRVKPAGITRVWLTGDSFTLGTGVEDGQCYAALLERRLSLGGRRVEVLNGGVDSYAPLLEYLDLEQRGFTFEPDLVVLAFDVSDLWQEQGYRLVTRFAADGTPLACSGLESLARIPPAVRAERWLRRHSYTWAWGLRRLDEWDRTWERTAILEGRAPGILDYTFREDQTPYLARWAEVEDSLRHVVQACRRRGVRFALVTYPWGHQVNEREWLDGRRATGVPAGRVAGQPGAARLAALAAREGVPFLDMTPAFRAAAAAPLYFRFDMHWTPAGHQVAAAALGEFLEREALVGEKAGYTHAQ